jgi:hypothetical protein
MTVLQISLLLGVAGVVAGTVLDGAIEAFGKLYDKDES